MLSNVRYVGAKASSATLRLPTVQYLKFSTHPMNIERAVHQCGLIYSSTLRVVRPGKAYRATPFTEKCC